MALQSTSTEGIQPDDTYGPGPYELILGAIAGIVGVTLRGVATADLGRPGWIVGYPDSGVVPAIAGALGALLVAGQLVVLYRALADRATARRVGAIAASAVLVAAVAGVPVALDTAVVGAAFLTLGIAVLYRGGDPSWLGWLGTGAGITLLVASLPALLNVLGLPAWNGDQASRLLGGLFVVAGSIVLGARASSTRTTEGGR